MRYLVNCSCRHSLERHGERGCGDCACAFDQYTALDAAIHTAKTMPWSPSPLPEKVVPVRS